MKALPSSLWTHHASNLHLAYPQKEKTMTPPEDRQLPEEDAKTMSDTPKTSALTTEYRGQPPSHEEIRKLITLSANLETDLTAARAEVERWVQVANDRSQEATEWTRKFIDQREENRRLNDLKASWQDGRMEGRREAVSMLIRMDPESLDDCLGNAPNGDSGDYTSVWITERLRAKFDCDERVGAYESLEGHYWTLKGENLWMEDENRRLRETLEHVKAYADHKQPGSIYDDKDKAEIVEVCQEALTESKA